MADTTAEKPVDRTVHHPPGGEIAAITPSVLDDVVVFSEAPQSFGQQAWKRFRSHKLAILGAILLVLLVLAFYLAPLFSEYEYDDINVLDRAQGPSWDHWFGTDDLGRDLFVRAMRGGRYSISISVITGLIAAAVGGLLGALAGYFGGIVDTLISYVINLFLTIPAIAVLLVLGVKFQLDQYKMAALIAALVWTRGARVVRALMLQFKEREFVLAAKSAGATSSRIIIKHLMPNVAGALLVEATLLAGTAIILESTLSFLGLGIQPPETTLGILIDEAKGSIDTSPARILIPGMLVVLIVLAINFIGDGLRDALDPQQELES